MRLKPKISLALCLAFTAAVVGLLPAYLALSEVEARFATTYITVEAPTEAAITLHEQIRFGLLSFTPGIAGVVLVLAALALLAQRQITTPIRTLKTATRELAEGTRLKPTILDTSDEIGDLSRSVAALAETALKAPEPEVPQPEVDEEDLQRFQEFTLLGADFCWETDASARLVFAGGRFGQGTDLDTLLGHPFDRLLTVLRDDDAPRALELVSGRPLDNLLCRYEAGTRRQLYRLTGAARYDEGGGFIGYRGIATDVTEQIETEKEAKATAFNDPLTGLPTKKLIVERGAQALGARALSGGDVAVIHIDLDTFKAVNDGYGHATGDRVLTEVANRLSDLLGPQDSLGRIGGDAFSIVQANGAQPEAAEHLCLSILKSLRDPIHVDGVNLEMTASLGCAIAAPEEGEITTLLRDADTAMYEAKAAGGNIYRLHDSAMTDALHARIGMERDLRHAVPNNEIDIYYRPVMRAMSGGIAGFETRLRWNRPDHGAVYADEFLSVAEETGLIVPIFAYVLKTACRTAMSWPNLTVALKVSPVCFLHDSLLPTIVTTLRQSNLSAHLLELEISESALLSTADTALFQFDALHELGVRLVMDKFGSGTSSLQHLQRYRFNKLKLHRSFVAGVATDPNSAEIVRSVLQMATALGLETCADGVAHEEQATLLSKFGCQTLQGPLFGKALSANRAFSLIRSEGIMPGAPKAQKHL
ncbi:MAG: EAL domain-containing protein [Pseudomonadota bacterium]